MMKRDRTAWARSALADLSPERALMDRLGPRYGNVREAEGGRGNFLFLYF